MCHGFGPWWIETRPKCLNVPRPALPWALPSPGDFRKGNHSHGYYTTTFSNRSNWRGYGTWIGHDAG